jgi:pyruvate kinase
MGSLDWLWKKSKKADAPTELHVTLWPAFDHFPMFGQDQRLDGIRLNSAMMEASEIDDDFQKRSSKAKVPLWFDIKAMQLRIREVVCDHSQDHLEFILNRPVKVKTPFYVTFKAGEDAAKCIEIKNGTHFIFENGPRYEVRAGESIHIRDAHEVGGPVFLDYEIEKIAKIVSLGFTKFYLSYVWDQRHVDEFRNFIGPSADLRLKIENQKGLDWVADGWKPQLNTNLIAARGDLYVELDRPHHIMDACKLIVERDPGATVGSRMLLSMVTPPPKTLEFLQYAKANLPTGLPDWVWKEWEAAARSHKESLSAPGVPRCADLSDLAWLYDIGYRSFLLCDELCLEEQLLRNAVNVFAAFREDYAK